MVIVVETNRDMPSCLNTDNKQKQLARKVAEAYFKKPTKSAQGPRIQGFFSRTMFVTFKDRSEVVIQFRPEPLDMTPFREARQVLGPVVPEITQIHDKDVEESGITIYQMTKIGGSTWSSAAIAGKKTTALPIINRSLGKIFANGYVQGDSTDVIDERLRPHLKLIAESDLEQIKPFQKYAKGILGQLDKLQVLPLWITHYDLNQMNIMLNTDFEISGLIDWELSFPQPFGVFLGRIHTLAGEYTEGEFFEPPEFEVAERALWTALYEGLAAKHDKIFKIIQDNPDLVQLAVELGTILNAFPFEEGKVDGGSRVVVKALPKFLTYRIPALRGDAAPYSR